MGSDKATLRLVEGGATLAQRTAGLLASVAHPCVEVGRGHSGLPAVREVPEGTGPLAGVARGWEALTASGFRGLVLVVATDLPALDLTTLQWLVAQPGAQSVVPVVDGHPQPLCARWSGADLDESVALVGQGHRAMHQLMERCRPVLLTSGRPGPFCDADTPGQARRLGVALPQRSGR
jgi:molybdopterin-guanine dinucleotide biosynthesis protein A